MATYRELTGVGVPTRAAAVLVGVARATATRRPRIPAPSRARVPVNKLTDVERAEILAVVNCPRFVDLPPIQIYAHLLDEGVYVGSISTIYRVLTANAQVKERRRLARHPARTIPELVATAPGQVYSWDITKLAGPVKGTYFDAYVMIDIYSRYIAGAHVHAAESAILAVEMMREIFGVHGIPRVVHADRGTSMTSKTVAALLSDLEVTKSHSRPRVSNDNPYSESWFKTLKFAPVFPDRFGSLGDARSFMADFVEGYNHHHHHTGIGLNTPADVHYGLATAKAAERALVLATARSRHPERFARTINALTALVRVDLGLDARRPLSAKQVAEISHWRAREESVAVVAARTEAIRLAKRVADLDTELSANQTRMRELLRNSEAASLLDKTGIGPVTAATALVTWSHPARVRSEAAFASLAGVNPIPASSGNISRHRVNRGGDRRLNRAWVSPRSVETSPLRR